MQLIIKTELAKIENYKPLNDEFDNSLIILFEKYFLAPYQPVVNLFEEFPSGFDRDLMGFFDRVKELDQQDNVFNALTPIFNSYVSRGLIDEAQKLWERILKTAHFWEEKTKKRIHKGSIYYFWAQPAILKGDIDSGFFLIHQAIEEDKITYKEKYTDSPAFKTATLNLNKEQFLYNFVISWRDLLGKYIDTYNKKYKKDFSPEEFNKKFLAHLPISESVFSFSHALAKISKLSNTPSEIIKNSYASTYELNLIFDFILVIDSILFHKDNSDWSYKVLVKKLISASGLNTNDEKNSLYLKESSDKMDDNSNIAINDLINGNIEFSDGYTPSSLECDIYLSYILRNYSAHNLLSIASIWKRFWEIHQSIINVLFLSVEVFY